MISIRIILDDSTKPLYINYPMIDSYSVPFPFGNISCLELQFTHYEKVIREIHIDEIIKLMDK